MNAVLLKNTVDRLRAIRSELLSRSAEKPTAERRPELTESALEQQNAERIAAQRSQDSRRLHKIDAALDAIREGTYGTCTECDGEIATKRLDAAPWATLCVKCAERQESTDREKWQAETVAIYAHGGNGFQYHRNEG